MTQEQILAKLKLLIKEQKRQSYIAPETIRDAEALGVLCAKYNLWSAPGIFDVVSSMLEESNFHTLNGQWKELIGERKRGN